MIATPPESLLVDTDVLIDFLRGRQEAVAFLEGVTAPLLISAMTVAELLVGTRNDEEEEATVTFLTAFELIPVDAEIAVAGGRLRARYGPSHGTGLADALIAASAEVRGARLVTRSRRHFPMLDDVLVPY